MVNIWSMVQTSGCVQCDKPLWVEKSMFENETYLLILLEGMSSLDICSCSSSLAIADSIPQLNLPTNKSAHYESPHYCGRKSTLGLLHQELSHYSTKDMLSVFQRLA